MTGRRHDRRPIPGHVAALLRDRRGLMAVEFAIAVPVLVLLVIGCFEITYSLQAEARLRTAAFGLAGLVAAQESITTATMNDLCAGAKLMMTPLAGSGFSAGVVSVTRSGSTNAQDWGDTTCGTAAALPTDPVNAAASVLVSDGDTAIVVRASYAYTSPMQFFLTGTTTLIQTAFARPIANETVTHP